MPLNELFNIHGKKIVITGATGGVGLWLSEGLASLGADLFLTDKDEEKLSSLKETIIGNHKVKVEVCCADLLDISSIKSMAQAAKAFLGQVDVLINNAGATLVKPALEISEKDYDAVLGVNLKAAFFCSQEFGHVMKEQENNEVKGKIINMASPKGYLVRPGSTTCLYDISKAGLIMLTKTLAVEWAKHKILVNSIGPAWLPVGLGKSARTDEQVLSTVLETIPLGRLADTDDIIGAICYLISNASNFVTGQTIFIDGGRTAL